ncbi:hypothetical protein Smic_40220 [Streptomyces microflavus]|uniref:Protein YobA n=1 Tax=Streptomyces microflavus TaxID=1919 RepID=A0A7J0CSH8_STRMI|nr:hypothetical protein Smic_40220 [Streptomyces microflavus]
MTATAPRLGASPIRRPFATAALVAALVSLLFGLMLAGAGPASAHAALTGSDPQDGAVVATAPKEVTLTFSEAIAVGDGSIRVLDPSSKRADTGAEPKDLSEGSTVRYGVELNPGLPDGTYTVAWQAVSADSHPISGAFTFSIGAPSETTVALPSEEVGGGPVGVVYGIARYAAYTGFILLVGGAAFVLGCWPRGASARPMQRLVVRGWVTLTAATLVMLLLRNPYTGSGKFADAFDLDGLQAVLDTKPGAALVSRLLLLGRPRCSSPSCSVRTPGVRTRSRRRTSPSASPSAAGSSRRASPPPGPCPSTRRPASRRGSPCRWTCCTCWPSPPGSAVSSRSWWRCTGRRTSGAVPYGGSPGSRSAACSSSRRPGSTSRGGRSAPGRH